MIDMSKWQQIAKEKIHVRPATQGRLSGKIAIVTGAAQGLARASLRSCTPRAPSSASPI